MYYRDAVRSQLAFRLKNQRIVYSDGALLLRAEIPFCCLNRAVPLQELDLLEVPAALPAELGAGRPQVVGTEVLDPDLFGGLLNDRPHGPVAQTFPHLGLLALGDAAQQRSLVDAGRGHPGVDSLLAPYRDGDGPHAPSLPFKIGQYPATFALLDRPDVERSELLPAQGATDQERKDDVVPFALEGRAIRNGSASVSRLS